MVDATIVANSFRSIINKFGNCTGRTIEKGFFQFEETANRRVGVTAFGASCVTRIE